MTRNEKTLGRANRLAIKAAVRKSKHVSYDLAIAIASRESGCKNILGDGGHGRGMFQLDDRYQQDYLRKTRGCKSGSSIPIYSSALPKGRVPTVYAGAARMCEIIESDIRSAIADGVPYGQRLRLALSAYNAGYQGALTGYHEGDSDKQTAHANYARDVLSRIGK